MPKKRAGSRLLKSLGPYDKMLPQIMRMRSDAQVFFDIDADCGPLDEYIKEKGEEGLKLTYLHIFTAALVRIYALYPALNRFVMNTKLYSYNKIYFSLAVRKKMREGESSTTIKIAFTGRENIYEVAKMIDEQIYSVKSGDDTKTDAIATKIMNLPTPIIKAVVSFIFFLDRHNMLPQAILDASPFHTSIFITYMKSLGVGSVYHHLYDFGTTGLFLGLGKEQYRALVNRKTMEVYAAKVLDLKIVADERLCDGYYHAKAVRFLEKMMRNPHMLDKSLGEIEPDVD